MLKDRILFTLRFFYLLQTSLTLSELRDFLFNDPQIIRRSIDGNFEISSEIPVPLPVDEQEIARTIKAMPDEVEEYQGFYCLKGSMSLIEQRISNEVYRDKREAIIKRFVPFLRFVPFVRGVAVGGSHILSQNKQESDIDLLIILDPQYFWLGRILVTAYFQFTGHRRHGGRIANRFCLNHYLAGPIAVSQERDPYNAMEYLRLRPEVYGQTIQIFVQKNLNWIRLFFPQGHPIQAFEQKQTILQAWFEVIFILFFGTWLNLLLGKWQMSRIMRGAPAVANETELSFHSKQRKFDFLTMFFENQKQENRITERSIT